MAEKQVNLKILFWFMRISLSAVFVYSGVLKAINHELFHIDVQSYRILWYKLSVVVAIYLPYLEIICGLAVLNKRLSRGALFILLVLIVVFIGFIFSAWVRGLNINCGCFGWSDNPTEYHMVLLRDAALLLTVGALLLGDRVVDRSGVTQS